LMTRLAQTMPKRQAPTRPESALAVSPVSVS
jgi:hypothetical protein